jgi:NAD(P)-dependent dehydrogenase (short-subunit alcohol dehydrogenase family)
VTGVGPGLGRAICEAGAQAGANVVMAARSIERLEQLAEEIRAAGGTAVGVRADVTDPDQCRNLVDVAVAEFGGLDGLVNSAFQQPPMQTVAEMSMESWRASFDINCHAAVQVTQTAIPELRRSAHASVVMIATMSIHLNRPRFAAYAAAKAATAAVARTLAAELGPDGIRVNTVAPGYIWGDSVRWYLQSQADARGLDYEVIENELRDQIALRRIPTPEAIAQTVVFYLSDMARDVTGTMLDVNAGQIMR